MDLLFLSQIIAITGIGLGALGILFRLRAIMKRPYKRDLSRARGSTRRGILYAFTLGMAPWEKESTRLHWMAYLRGILFHTGIFAAFAVLFSYPWLANLPALVIYGLAALIGLGSIAGFGGILMRWAGPNERVLSLPDDYFSVFLTSLFSGLAALTLVLPGWLPLFYLTAGLLGVYIPFSKIRHCVYFFYSKFFFGLSFGRRRVIGQPKSEYAE